MHELLFVRSWRLALNSAALFQISMVTWKHLSKTSNINETFHTPYWGHDHCNPGSICVIFEHLQKEEVAIPTWWGVLCCRGTIAWLLMVTRRCAYKRTLQVAPLLFPTTAQAFSFAALCPKPPAVPQKGEATTPVGAHVAENPEDGPWDKKNHATHVFPPNKCENKITTVNKRTVKKLI